MYCAATTSVLKCVSTRCLAAVACHLGRLYRVRIDDAIRVQAVLHPRVERQRQYPRMCAASPTSVDTRERLLIASANTLGDASEMDVSVHRSITG